jgi:hypothetical protein
MRGPDSHTQLPALGAIVLGLVAVVAVVALVVLVAVLRTR